MQYVLMRGRNITACKANAQAARVIKEHSLQCSYLCVVQICVRMLATLLVTNTSCYCSSVQCLPLLLLLHTANTSANTLQAHRTAQQQQQLQC
jgi:hypothetical protein